MFVGHIIRNAEKPYHNGYTVKFGNYNDKNTFNFLVIYFLNTFYMEILFPLSHGDKRLDSFFTCRQEAAFIH